MNDLEKLDTESFAITKRSPWHAPQIVLLPIDETAQSASTGNDGNGNGSGS